MKNSKINKLAHHRGWRWMFVMIVAFIVAGCADSGGGEDAADQLCSRLDVEIGRSEEYDEAKRKRIDDLRSRVHLVPDGKERTEIINRLVTENEAFNADSALHYIQLNLMRPAVKRVPGEYTRLLIKQADLFGHAGLFPEALSVMMRIPADSISPDVKPQYYSTYCAIYQYMSEYANETEAAHEYEHLRSLYADSVRQVTRPDSFDYQIYAMSEMARRGEVDKAVKELTGHLDNYRIGTREYSIIASTLAYIYKTSGRRSEYKQHIVLSALSDVQGAVKENMSFRELATAMYEDGDVERANRYLKKSFADANFYAARMRNAQSSKMLPVIDEAYALSQHNLNNRLRWMVWLSLLLSVILLGAMWFIWRQMKRVRRAHANVRRVNRELSDLSAQVRATNVQLEDRNRRLSGVNRIIEQYAGIFMEYCSLAISSWQRYQQSLRVLAMQSGKRQALLDKLDSSELSDSLLKEFYAKFDEAILTFYPTFVEQVNVLLRDDEKIKLKSGELLNTELRIFALIRVGIDDSTKIAQFLRCSLTTVYTYRSKLRRRALSPDTFESDIKSIDS